MKHWKPTGQTQQVWRFPTGFMVFLSFFFSSVQIRPKTVPIPSLFPIFGLPLLHKAWLPKIPPVASWLLQHIRLEEGKQMGNQLPVANVARTSAGCNSN